MRVLARLSAVAAVVVFALLSAAPTAVAGGPTSVLLVAPATGDTASLHVEDPGYDRLLGALGETVTAEAGAPDLRSLPGTSALNVTWLVHDVQVWRVDRVHLDTTDGPWVQTWTSYEGIDLGQDGTTHRPADSAQLRHLLTELGVANGDARQPALAEGQLSQPIPRPDATRETDGAEWVWLLAGTAFGAVIVIGSRPVIGLARQRGRRSPGHLDP